MKKVWALVSLALVVLVAFGWWKRRSLERVYYGWQVSTSRTALLAQERKQIRNLPAHQIYNELEWVFGKTYDYPRTRERLRAFRTALAEPRNFAAEDEQSAEDGSWGKWHTEWL